MAFVAESIQNMILNPLVTGPLLLIPTCGPAVIREPLRSQLAALLNEENVKRLILALIWALAIGIVQQINSWLNTIALDNWQVRPAKDRWVWDSEVAVVTGGSSGIGAEIAKLLVRKGVTVAVLDILPLQKDLEGCKL